MEVLSVRVSPSGRLSLPAEVRKAMGVHNGGDLVLQIEGRDVRLRSHADVVAEALAISRRLLGGDPDASVEALIAERRREAEQE